MTKDIVAYIETVSELGTGGGDDLHYALNLAETVELPEPFKARLAARIRAIVPKVIARDPSQWNSYCIAPLKLVTSPQSLAADLIPQDVQAHLDFQIDHQAAEGGWEPTWSWGSFYPQEWEQAKVEWRGRLTLDALTTLRAFGRLVAIA